MNHSRVFLAGIAALMTVLSGCSTVGRSDQRSSADRNGQHAPLGEHHARVLISLEPGDHYEHRLQISRIMRVRVRPQIALWIEDERGFRRTLFVTRRTGEASWRAAPLEDVKGEIRRPEALPRWVHQREAVVGTGRGLPTPDLPAPDAVTGATPRASFRIERLVDLSSPRWIYLEVNSSTDFNDAYPIDAVSGDPGYSGGPWGSGQPALVYRALLTPAMMGTSGRTPVSFELYGSSSPDGASGTIERNLEGISTARSIVAGASIEIVQQSTGGRR